MERRRHPRVGLILHACESAELRPPEGGNNLSLLKTVWREFDLALPQMLPDMSVAGSCPAEVAFAEILSLAQ
jgi:hypothetical protein